MAIIYGVNGTPARSVDTLPNDRPCLQLNVMSMDDANDVIADSNGIVQTARKLGLDHVEILLDYRRAAELRAKLQGVFSPKVLKVLWKTHEIPTIGRNTIYTPPTRPLSESVPIKQYALPKPPKEEGDEQTVVEKTPAPTQAPKLIGRPANPSRMSPDLLKARQAAA
jgi:hypothetical protein